LAFQWPLGATSARYFGNLIVNKDLTQFKWQADADHSARNAVLNQLTPQANANYIATRGQ